jgi:DNA end-binding protein Ku
VLIKPEELDELKLEAKHTINLERFVDRSDVDSRYFEKPYYLLPDGDQAEEGYAVMRDALSKTDKIAIGQLIMLGHEHLVGITAHGKGLMLEHLRYAQELRDPELYYEKITAEPKDDAVGMAVELINRHSGKFEPKKMPNEFAKAVKELVRAKMQHRAPEVTIEPESPEVPKVWLRSKRACRPKGVGTCAMR